jgi:hypothetical protein
MNSPKLFPSLCSAPDALFDQLERDLCALTTAALDDERTPRQCVDEFSNEFLMQWSLPPNEP